MSETPLSCVDGWTADHVSSMSEVWITTAEQVVALGATDGGLRAITEQLQIDARTAEQLLDAARAVLPAAARNELDRPAETRDLGLGVLPPRPNEK